MQRREVEAKGRRASGGEHGSEIEVGFCVGDMDRAKEVFGERELVDEESWSWDVMEKIFLSECVGVEIFFVGPVVKLDGGVRRVRGIFFLARGRGDS